MAMTHKITWALAANGQQVLSASQSESGSAEQSVDATIPAGATDQAVALAFVRSAVQSLLVVSDKPLTLKTNSTSSPGDTKALVAGCPIQWDKSAGYFALSAIFSADVTVIYLTNAGSAAARFQARVLTS